MADPKPSAEHHEQIQNQRWELLGRFHDLLEKPLTFLAFVWLVLVILNFTTHTGRMLREVMLGIWCVFLLNFLVEFFIAPHKLNYLKKHWLTAVSLAVPALGVFRVVPFLQILFTVHGAGFLSLLQLMSSLNRGMRAVQQTMRRRGVGYVLAITVIVLFAGAAGMLSFESPHALIANGAESAVRQGAGLHGYSDALWWTAMLMTTIGSAYWPLTPEGRILCWFLSLYAISAFGYLTASIASHFIGEDTGEEESDEPTANEKLRGEIAQLSSQITALVARLDSQGAGGQ
ncbi:MAG TPA: potassium channel family protein [Capsulimonadaceae bacterium]|nr:potassium channel family protein [Capsulimonadaceae bacterium]